MKISGWISIATFLCLLIFSNAALAETCSLDSASVFKSASNVSMPLNISSIAVSNDIPDGTIIYQQKYVPSYSSISVNCDESRSWYYVMSLTNTPMPLSSGPGPLFLMRVGQLNILGRIYIRNGYTGDWDYNFNDERSQTGTRYCWYKLLRK